MSDSQLLVNDLTGWNLGEKARIKEQITKYFTAAAAKFAEYKMNLDVDMPSFQSISKGTNKRDLVWQLFEDICVEYGKEMEKFCANQDYKEAIQGVIDRVLFQCECLDEKKPRASYEIKDRTLLIKINIWFLAYSADTWHLKDFLEKAL